MGLKQDKFQKFLEDFKIDIKDESEVFEWFKIKRRFPHEFHTQRPCVEVINSYDGDSQHRGLFDPEGFLDIERLKEYYNNNHTIILSNVLDLHEDLRRLEKHLQKTFGFFPGHGNLYFSKDTGSFPSHDHQYDVMVKQIYGTCFWKIGGDNDVVLAPGDVLYIPKGTTHYVNKVNGPRLSLTINMR